MSSTTFAEKISKFIEESLRMNVWVLLAHIVVVILIVSFVAIWVWKPTNEFIAQQKKKLDKEKNDLVVNNRETRYFLGLLKKEKYELFYTKRAITKAAADEAEKIRLEAKLAADKYVKELQAQAEDRIGVMEEKARQKVKQYIVDAALELTEKLVDANMNEANNKAVIDAYIKDLENKKIVEGEDRKVF